MGSKVLCLSVALLQYLMICKHVRAQCTQPSFESKNVVLSDSHLSTQSFPDGSSVTFECEIGHRPVNSRASKSVTCQGTQWTSLDLECTRKSCGSPPDFFHGRYEKTGILFGDKITAVCDKGYMLAGQIKDRWCRDQGWDGRDPVCEVVKCLAPPAIENGQLEDVPLESYDYLQVVSYVCNDGLSLSGTSTLYCSEDGTFKPDPPKCLDGCPKPDIPNAHRTGGKSPPYKLGNFLDYKCDDGYTMKGEDHIVCTAKGWSPEPPTCTVVKCVAPPAIENGQLGEEPLDSYDYNQVVSYKCNHGFSLTGDSTLRCSEDGTFKPDPPKCLVVKCVAPPAIENGQLGEEPLDSYDYNQVVSYKCNHGFSLTGDSTLRCSEDGTFKPDPPKCLVVKCVAPPAIENGQLGEEPLDSYDYNQVVSYKCNHGFSLTGDSTLRCSQDGTFKPDPPKCLALPPTTTAPKATSKEPTSTIPTDAIPHHTNTIGIVFGVLGGLAAIVVIGVLFYKCYWSKHRYSEKVAGNEEREL